jgi:hypothetical protein
MFRGVVFANFGGFILHNIAVVIMEDIDIAIGIESAPWSRIPATTEITLVERVLTKFVRAMALNLKARFSCAMAGDWAALKKIAIDNTVICVVRCGREWNWAMIGPVIAKANAPKSPNENARDVPASS